jgi:nitroimidazol reductase NimA-like FMN-containing flavoprotein (pyridoxamine 5'-phosphate oxidase superfamily)
MEKFHMFKEEQEINDNITINEILKNGKYSTIALCKKTKPYLVTLNYGFHKEKNALYFHSAIKGLKLEIIKKNNEVCGTVIEDKGYLMNRCMHAYRSVVYFGKISIIEDIEEKRLAIDIMLNQLEEKPDVVKQKYIKNEASYKNVAILRIDIYSIRGKEGK